MKILLADDEQMVRDVAKAMLNHLGYTVFLAANGQEALDYFESHKDEIDLLILDIGMPVLDGYACLKKIREQSDVPVLITSGVGSSISPDEIEEISAQGVLAKPFSLDILKETIESVIAK